MQRKQILKEITQLNSLKADQNTDITNKIIKQIPSFHLALKMQIKPRFLRKVIET